MKRTLAIALAAVTLIACGPGDRECPATPAVPAPLCDWETALWDGERCLLRTDHEGHMGHQI